MRRLLQVHEKRDALSIIEIVEVVIFSVIANFTIGHASFDDLHIAISE
ncbi:MAG: hypothetical protein ACXADL_11080 [Candidatus Thorarchaeota archaeon]|jgi:hypothetical protein